MIFFTPPKTEYINPFEAARFNFAWRICTVLAPIFLVLSLIYLYKQDLIFIDYLITFIFSLGLLGYQNYSRKYELSYHVIALVGTFFPLLTIYTMEEYIHYSSFFWITCIMLITFFGLGVRKGMILVCIDVVGFGVYILTLMNNNISKIQPLETPQKVAMIFEITTIAFLLGYVFYKMISLYKKSEENLIKMNSHLDDRYKEKIVLIKEVHHRVKNNLQIIISLLRMQRDELKSEEAKNQFTEAINRIMTMSLIHGKLYSEQNLSRINLNAYVEELFGEIQSIFDYDQKTVIDCKIEIDTLDLQTVVSVGLLLNELISNSFKYAFTNKESGVITIKVRFVSEKKFELYYSDNGKWVPSKSDKNGFGVELIDLLTGQLEGEKDFSFDEKGTHYCFKLSIIDEE